MPKCLVLAALSALGAAASAAEIYRWVDENGVVHYSDSPRPGAEEVVLPDSPPPASTSRAYDRSQRTPPTDGDEASSPGFDYASLAVVQPEADETLWNIEGQLTVGLSLQPALRAGDRVQVYFDGEQREVQGLQFELQEVWRGTHILQAEILNEAGQTMIRSEAIRFHVHQTSIATPN